MTLCYINNNEEYKKKKRIISLLFIALPNYKIIV